jgi:hypothetical protein
MSQNEFEIVYVNGHMESRAIVKPTMSNTFAPANPAHGYTEVVTGSDGYIKTGKIQHIQAATDLMRGKGAILSTAQSPGGTPDPDGSMDSIVKVGNVEMTIRQAVSLGFLHLDRHGNAREGSPDKEGD